MPSKRNGLLWASIAAVSAIGVAFTLDWEGAPQPGQTEVRAIVPVKGDPPTLDVGGLTYYPSTGERVKRGDRVPIEVAVREFSFAVAEDADCVRRSCLTCHGQALFDLAADFVHQYGCGRWNGSSLLPLLREDSLDEHCAFYLRYRFVRGFDCSMPGNRVCTGVWKRAQRRHELCREAIEAEPQ